MRVIRHVPLEATHPDYPMYKRIEGVLLRQGGGLAKIRKEFPVLLWEAVDEIIDTRRTGRVYLDQLEKTEKTYIGTKVEILVRKYFALPKGRLDLVIDGLDVDVKYTSGSTWMIPKEAIDHACLVIAIDEKKRLCFFGIVVAHPSNLTNSTNQDLKGSISAVGASNIHWLLVNEPIPESFWSTVGPAKTELIMSGRSGTERISSLFREVMRTPVSREIVRQVGQQKDALKRLRKNGGARDVLARDAIAVLSGHYDVTAIRELGLPTIAKDEFISIQASTAQQRDILKRHGNLD